MSTMLETAPVDHTHRWEEANAETPASLAEQLAPALARLELGGDLTNADRELLDRLSPQNCLTFMVSNGVWLHPDNVPLFDYSFIDRQVTQCGSAVMTHHYRPRHGATETFAVQTAIINPGWEQPLVFGTFGPSAVVGDYSVQQAFEQTVSDLRTAYQIASTAVRRILAELARIEPVLIVTPNDGRIVTANSSAATALEVTPMELAGLPYEDIAHLLQGITTVTRLESGPIDFSMICVAPTSSDTRQPETSEPAEPVPTDLAGAIAQMFAAIKDLEELTQRSRDSVSAGVMHTIHNQARVLRSRLTHLTGVSDNDR